MHWKEELTMPEDNKDIPAEWRGQQVISREQRLMMLDDAKMVQFCTARKIGKTLIIESRYFQIPLLNLTKHRAAEGMFFTPRQVHRDPVVGRIKAKADKVPLFRLIKDSFNVNTQEFRFRGKDSSFVWYNRIEGDEAKRGEKMVGLRCSYMLGDEGAYGNDSAYAERLNTALPNAKWLWCGVPNGIRRTKFHRISETPEGKGWSRHRWDFRANPQYHNRASVLRLIEDHGGVQSQGFQTQVLARWGEATVASFPIIPTTGKFPFTLRELTGDVISARIHELKLLLNLRIPEEYEEFIIGGDLGYSPSPTVLTILFRLRGAWIEMARITMLAVSRINQARVIDTICMKILPKRPVRGCLDAHGSGAGLLEDLHELPEFDNAYYREAFMDAGFGGNTPDPRIPVHPKCQQRVREGADGGIWYCDKCGVTLNASQIRPANIPSKQYLTIDLKEAFLNGQDYLISGRI